MTPSVRSLIGFVALAYGLSWGLWLPLLLASEPVPPETALTWHWAGSLGPCLAGVIVAAARGRPAWRDWATGLGRWRAPWPLWAAVLAGPTVALAVGLWLTGMTGGPAPVWADMTRWPDWPWSARWLFPLLLMIFVGLGEEGGWRGFLLPALLARLGFRGAAMVVALIWAGWHLPLFFFRPTLAAMDMAGIAGWAFSILVGSVLTAWIHCRTGGALGPLIVLHATLDLAFTAQATTPTLNAGLGMALTAIALYGLHRHPLPPDSPRPGGLHG